MPRPCKIRKINGKFKVKFFKPHRIPMNSIKTVCLDVCEAEAVRLADLEGMYHEDAAKQMEVSRQTFGNIIKSAHKKIADALINGKSIKIENV